MSERYSDKLEGASRPCFWNTKLDTLTNNITYVSGEVISDGFFMAKDAFGVKRMTLHKDCTINGRRIADMTKEELDAWIAEKAKQDKIITIL